MLRPYVHAAALVGADIGQVLLWLDQQEASEPARIIESHNPRAAVWAARLRGLAGSPSPVTIGGYFETAKSCFGALQDPAVLESCSRSSLDVESFLDSASTLFVVDPAGEAETSPTAPLTAALVDWICDRAYARARRHGLCEPRLGLFLDEVSNIAPLASLGRHLAQGASQGVHVACWSAQAFAQLEERYERGASTIWGLTRYALVFGGSREVEWLERISALAGEFEEPERTVTRSSGREERSVAERPARRRVLSVESLARLPRGEAVLLTEGEVVRVVVPPLHAGSSAALRPLARMLGRPSAAASVLQPAARSKLDAPGSKSARPALPIAGGPGGEAA